MKTVGMIALFLVVCVLGYVGYVAAFKDSKVAMDKAVLIDARSEIVFAHINSLELFHSKWSPWSELDPDMEVTYVGENREGMDASYAWKSDNKNVGEGSMTIVESVSNEKVVHNIEFVGMGSAVAEVSMKEMDGKFQVTWGFVSDIGFMGKVFTSSEAVAESVGKDYEKGLAKLREACEKLETEKRAEEEAAKAIEDAENEDVEDLEDTSAEG